MSQKHTDHETTVEGIGSWTQAPRRKCRCLLLELLQHTHQLLNMLQQAGRFLVPCTGELQFVFHFTCKL